MASKNNLLGHNAPEDEEEVGEVKESKPKKLYRYDCKKGRIFPAGMVEMMKIKKWVEKPSLIELSKKAEKVESPEEMEARIRKEVEDKLRKELETAKKEDNFDLAAFFSSDEESKIDHSEEKE